MSTYWRDDYESKVSTPKKALSQLKPGKTIFISGGCAFPKYIVENLLMKNQSHDNKILTPYIFNDSPLLDENVQKNYKINSFYLDGNIDSKLSTGLMDYTPIRISEVPYMLESGRIPVDIAIIQVSAPDMHGYCSFGVSVDLSKAAVKASEIVIAEVNRQMPRTLGDSFIHVSELDYIIEVDYPIDHPLDDDGVPQSVIDSIGINVSKLITDNSTLQVGIGRLPDAILCHLKDKKNLGIHTEMFSDGVLDMIEAGVITGEKKSQHKNKVVTSFVMGSQRLMEFVDNNPMIEFLPSDYTCNPIVIAGNSKMVTINTASAVGLAGQTISGGSEFEHKDSPGSQAEFTTGAAYSRGRTIIVMPSTTSDGKSRIIAHMPKGSGMISAREDVHYVVTEYGIAHLRGRTLANRALEIIGVAHPSHREELLDIAVRMGYLPKDQSKRTFMGKPYPYEFEYFENVGGKELFIRPLRPTDEDMLKELFYSFSEKTIKQRFMSTKVTQSRLERMTQANIDYDITMGFGVFHRVSEFTEMIATCSYERDPNMSNAEVSFAVRDDWQGKGLGTYLLKLMINVGRMRNIKTFTAEVLATNVGMLNLFYRTGLDVSAKLEDDVYLISFELVKKSN